MEAAGLLRPGAQQRQQPVSSAHLTAPECLNGRHHGAVHRYGRTRWLQRSGTCPPSCRLSGQHGRLHALLAGRRSQRGCCRGSLPRCEGLLSSTPSCPGVPDQAAACAKFRYIQAERGQISVKSPHACSRLAHATCSVAAAANALLRLAGTLTAAAADTMAHAGGPAAALQRNCT